MARPLSVLAAVCVLTWAAPATAQNPAPLAEERVDLDGDGTRDVVRVEATAQLTVSITDKPNAGGWKPFTLDAGTVETARIRVAPTRGRVLVVAEVAGDGRAETLALVYARGTLRELWRGATGTVGRDREHSVHVEPTPSGLLRYQRRPGVTRCDGVEPRLFLEGWDGRSKTFRPVYNRPRLPADAPTLTATTEAPANAPAQSLIFRAAVSSHQAGARNAADLPAPREIDDGDPATAWREGLGGNGVGEFITARTNLAARRVAAVRIVPGDASSDEAFARANRLRRVGLVLDADTAYWIEIPRDPRDRNEVWWVTLPEDAPATRCASLVIGQVYPGRGVRGRGGTTAIAELAVLADADLAPGGPEAMLAEAVAEGGREGQSAARRLRVRGAAGAKALLDALGKSGRTDAERMRLRVALARVGDPSGAGEIARALASPDASASEREVLERALTDMGEDAIPALTSLLGDDDASAAGRIAAARALGAIPGDASVAALISAAGAGPRAARRAVSGALARTGAVAAVTDAVAAAASAGDAGKEADLWRALGAMAAAGKDRSGLAERIAGRLATATGYELRYRLFAAAGENPDPAVIEALAAAVARTDESPRGTALRRVAVSALGGNPASEARNLIVTFVADDDPGVRIRAIRALGERRDADAASTDALTHGLADDSWPVVRKAAASALAGRCGRSRSAAEALAGAVDRDDDLAVRVEALVSLVGCRAPGIGDRLLATAADGKAPTELRDRALTLIAALGDPTLGPRLVEVYDQLKSASWSREESIALAAAALHSLGKLGGSAAVETLLGAAREPSFPAIQAAALSALGDLCPAAALPIFDRQAGNHDRTVSLAAQSARTRCRK